MFIVFVIISLLHPVWSHEVQSIFVFRMESSSVDHALWTNDSKERMVLQSNTSHVRLEAEGAWLSSSASVGEHSLTLSSPSRTLTLKVIVREMTKDTISHFSCRIRIANTTPSSILSSSGREETPYDKLRQQLYQLVVSDANITSITPECVLLYSMYDEVDDNVNYTIIRLAVCQTGGKFLAKEYLTGILTLHKSKLMRRTKLNIESIGYNECMRGELVHCNDSCGSVLSIKQNTFDLITGSRQSMSSVKVSSRAECICLADFMRNTVTCYSDDNICRHRGSCLDSSEGPACKCNEPYTGPNCELQSFRLKRNSYLWLPPLQTCAKSTLTIEFTTLMADCLLLYNGPMTRVDAKNIADFISLELRSGFPRLLINTGSGPSELTLPSHALNDGRRHRLIIEWINGRIFIYRKNCFNLQSNSCYNATDMPGTHRYLNVNTPLQLGRVRVDSDVFHGVTPRPNLNLSFDGRIETLKFNEIHYDMAKNSHLQQIVALNPSYMASISVREPDPVEEEKHKYIYIASLVILFTVIGGIILLLWWRCKSRSKEKKQAAKEVGESMDKQFNGETVALSSNMSKIFLNPSADRRENSRQIQELAVSKLQGSPRGQSFALSPVAREANRPRPVPPAPSAKWSRFRDSGPVDTIVPYALEGAYSPGPTLSTIDEIETMNRVDNCQLIDQFVNEYLERSTVSSNDGAEDYV